MIGRVEAFTGVGITLGPLAGSFLFQVGSFASVFYSLVGIYVICAILTNCCVPEAADVRHDEDMIEE